MISESMDFPMSSLDKTTRNNSEQTKTIIAQPKDAKTKTKTAKTTDQTNKLDEISNRNEEPKRKLLHHGNKTAGQLLVKSSSCKKVSTKSGTSGGTNKKEKKRYEEVIIDGVTINAFKTWEDLQDELNEQITVNRLTSRYNEHVNASHCSLTTRDSYYSSGSSLTPDVTSQADPNTTSSSASNNDLIVQKIGMATQDGNSGLRDEPVRCKIEQSPDDDRRPPSLLDHHELTEAMKAKEEADRHYFLLQERLKQERKKKKKQHKERDRERDNSDRHHHGSESDQVRKQDTRASATNDSETIKYSSSNSTSRTNPSYQNQNESIYLNKPVPRTAISHQQNLLASSQYRNEFENKQGHSQQSSYHQAPPPMHPQLSGMTRDHQPMGPSTAHYQQPPITPSIVQMNNPNHQYSQQQYLNSSQPLYQQHSRDSQQLHQQSHLPPMNHSYVPSFAHPAAPHCSPLMAQSSLPGSYNSPYTITDTIISRQTSIIPPPMGLYQLPGGRYGNYPQPNALDPIGLLHQGPGYVPSATERSFMEFARSYASASNMSNFMKSSSSASSLGNFGPGSSGVGSGGGLNSNLSRFAMDSQRASSGYNGLPPGLPDPVMSRFSLPSYNMDTRSAISAASFYPPYQFR